MTSVGRASSRGMVHLWAQPAPVHGYPNTCDLCGHTWLKIKEPHQE